MNASPPPGAALSPFCGFDSSSAASAVASECAQSRWAIASSALYADRAYAAMRIRRSPWNPTVTIASCRLRGGVRRR